MENHVAKIKTRKEINMKNKSKKVVSMSTIEKYIFAKNSVHFGVIRRDVKRGSVISYNPETFEMDVDGVVYKDSRDFHVCKRATEANPSNPWIVPYTEANLKKFAPSAVPEKTYGQKKMDKLKALQVINSDNDIIPSMEINDGKVSKALNSQKRVEASSDEDEIPYGLDATMTPKVPKKLSVVSDSNNSATIVSGGKQQSLNSGTTVTPQKRTFSVTASNAASDVNVVIPKMKVVRGGEQSLSGEGYSSKSSLNAGTKISGKKVAQAEKAPASSEPVRKAKKL